MFCAPSNAAVDELTKRLKKHFLDEKLDYKILRIGRPENVHTEVAHLTLGGMISASSDQEATKKAECDALTLILRPLEKKWTFFTSPKTRSSTSSTCYSRVLALLFSTLSIPPSRN